MPDDLTDPSRRLAILDQLAADHERLFAKQLPVTAALLVALSRPIDEIEARAPEFEPEGVVTGLQAIAEAMVRKAARGDASAFAQIVDRIEGKVGPRKGDTDEDVARHAQVVEATIEGVVEALTNRRLRPLNPSNPPAQPQLVDASSDNGQSLPQRDEGTSINHVDESTG